MAPDAKTERFTLRLSPVEVALLNELADTMGVSASDVIRLLIREKHAERFGKARRRVPGVAKP